MGLCLAVLNQIDPKLRWEFLLDSYCETYVPHFGRTSLFHTLLKDVTLGITTGFLPVFSGPGIRIALYEYRSHVYEYRSHMYEDMSLLHEYGSLAFEYTLCFVECVCVYSKEIVYVSIDTSICTYTCMYA